MTTPLLRVAIQERQRLYRDALGRVIDAEADLTVVASAASPGDLLSALAGVEVDVVLTELDTDDWDPCALVAGLRQRRPGLLVVGIWPGNEPTGDLPASAYRARVRRVLPRAAGMHALLELVRSPSNSSLTGVRSRPVAARGTMNRFEEPRPLLTSREVEVLGAIGTGATTRGVARTMGISPKTVEHHKERIFSKLGVQNQAHAVSVALRRGLISPPSLPTSA